MRIDKTSFFIGLIIGGVILYFYTTSIPKPTKCEIEINYPNRTHVIIGVLKND